jgi:diaminopimelate decarboxylase
MTPNTPYYHYDLDLLEQTLAEVKTHAATYNYHVHYALKANSNDHILAIIKDHGIGADCVSGNEVSKALATGFAAQDIVFAGVGKTDAEINLALSHDILCFNTESIHEIEVINELAAKQHKVAKIALRINPNVNAHTHRYITTGLEENKFGINHWEFEQVLETLRKSAHIECTGLHFHIGSQITNMTVFVELAQAVNKINQWFIDKGVDISMVNLGGGLGIDYENPSENPIPDFKIYFGAFAKHLNLRADQQVHFELGRSIVGQCGSLMTRVLYIKKGLHKNFLILDGGMTELIRPALYQSHHLIENTSRSDEPTEQYDVVGPICESSDSFGEGVRLPISHRGDLIAIRSAGAYGEVMASNYNLRTLNPAVLDRHQQKHERLIYK